MSAGVTGAPFLGGSPLILPPGPIGPWSVTPARDAVHSSASPTTAVAPSTCRIRTVVADGEGLAASAGCGRSTRRRPSGSGRREKSISRVTCAVRPMRVSTPSSCSGRPLREVLRGDRAGPARAARRRRR